MDVSPLDPDSRGQTDNYPLLMERPENHNDPEHVIDIARGSDASLSNSSHSDYHDAHDAEPAQPAGRPSSTARPTNYQSNLSNSSSVRRGDEYGRRRRSPLNSGLWISIELVVIISQIITAIVVLSLSRHENPQAPLFAWIVGYAAGCVATLPILYLRYCHRNQNMEQESTQSRAQSNPAAEPAPYTAISVSRTSEDRLRTARTGHNMRALSARLNVLTDHYKMALDCFFAVWFVVGNVWIFGGHSSSSEAPNLYRLCIVFLTISCIGYAMPFILCATICCCLPCIISILGFREDLSHTRGATPESISALPTYKFKVKKNGAESNGELDSDGVAEGGVVAAGTEKERSISAEDAVCCICLARYADNDELRELPCAHFFHMECVDKWLKINALCPLCKCEVGECSEASPSVENSSQNHGERVPNRAAGGETYGSTVF